MDIRKILFFNRKLNRFIAGLTLYAAMCLYMQFCAVPEAAPPAGKPSAERAFDSTDDALTDALLRYEAEKVERKIRLENPAPEEARRRRENIASESFSDEVDAYVENHNRRCGELKYDAAECDASKRRLIDEIAVYLQSAQPAPEKTADRKPERTAH